MKDLQKGDRLTADWLRDLIREVRRNRVVAGHGLRASQTPQGQVVSLERPRGPAALLPAGWPFGRGFAWGIVSISGAAVTIAQGTFEEGATYGVAGETSITITGLGQYIGLQCVRASGVCTITGPHAARPVSDADHYRTALHVFDLVDGKAVWVRECINDIRLGASL
jgi:hypothetical protein